MSWLDDITPDFTNPTTAAAFGALAGLGKASTPVLGQHGMSWGNALFGTLGDVAGGMQDGQKLQAEALANQNSSVMNPIGQQTAQLALQRQQALQPMMLQTLQNGMNGGNMPGGNAPPLTQADRQFAQAYQLAMASGKIEDAAKVLQSWAEHSPQLAGAVKDAQEQNSIHEGPNGPIWGSMVPHPTPSGVLNGVVSDRSPVTIGPGNQQPLDGSIPSPPPAGAFANLNTQQAAGALPASSGAEGAGIQVSGAPPAPDAPISSFPTPTPAKKSFEIPKPDGSKVGVQGAIKATEDNAANLADAGKTYNVMLSNFPNVQQRIEDMTKANKQSSFGPLNDKDGKGIVSQFHDYKNDDASVANTIIQQRAAQGILPELEPQLGAIKPNKSLELWANQANNIDLGKGGRARQEQFDGLMKGYIQNMVSYHDQIQGLGGEPSPLPPPVVAQAVKYKVMTRAEGLKYLQENHGMQ